MVGDLLRQGVGFTIRSFRSGDEIGWVRCRALAFLDTAYYDDVHPQKERYDGRAIELLAEADGLERAIRRGEVEALHRAAELALEIDTRLRAVSRELSGEAG
jgi:hypothetical protein